MFGKEKFYSLKKILSFDCQYNIIIGAAYCGKTYSVLKYGLEKYLKNGEQMSYIKRCSKDFINNKGSVLFDSLVRHNEIEKMSNGQYNNIFYKSRKWYLCKVVNGERIKTDEKPFCYGFSITSPNQCNDSTLRNITTICFDDFLTSEEYLFNEYNDFIYLINSITQNRDNVKIFMLGNPLTNISPYFSIFENINLKNMKKGDINVYTYRDNKYGNKKISIELCEG